SFPEEYESLLKANIYPYQFLNPDEKKRYKLKILYFLTYKNFNPIADFKITDEVKFLIAAQACLLIVNIDTKVFPELYNIYIAADTYIEKDNMINYQTM